MYSSEREKLVKFINLRNKYIDMLEKGKITKLEFNRKNNEIYEKINLRPFTVLDSFEKALYNYNYYNSKAKMYLEMYNYYKRLKDARSIRKAKIAENNKLNNYFHKDEALFWMLKNENSKFIEAYYINMYSKSLAEIIFEIHFLNREKIILHSKNPKIKKFLIELGCFSNELKDSLISSYINN